MQKGVMSQVQTGRQYAKKWPMRQELAPLFAEFRVIKATDLAITVMPILAMQECAKLGYDLPSAHC